MAPNYNSTACFYDQLSQLLFGKALINAQVYLLRHIKPGSTVLIVGGGTGWILDEISKLHPSGLNITYVEIAEKMMAKALKRQTAENSVNFVTDDAQNLPSAIKYDVIITPFLFDNFSQESAGRLFNSINNLLKPGGLWLYCDFQLTGRWWQTILLKLMLFFFKLLCNVEANNLPNVERLFDANNHKATAQQSFFGDFVISKKYQSEAG